MIDKNNAALETFPPTRTEGLRRLSEFTPKAGRAYATGRNTDRGPERAAAVSKLSPYIRHRLITEHEVIETVLEAHSLQGSEKYIQEVMWRTYFKGWLEHRPSVWEAYKDGVEAALSELETDEKLRRDYDAAIAGQTGIAYFDSWAKELVTFGYLHNHTRMWFASIWIFTLELPWELGADFFLRHLLDGDPAANTCSWRWVGGLHTKGKTYLARPSNIERFTDGRFSPGRELAPEALPLSENSEHLQSPLPISDTFDASGDVGLLLHEEDMDGSFLSEKYDIASCAGFICTDARSPLPISDDVKTFARAAMRDALSRHDSTNVTDTAEGVLDWAKTNDLTAVILPYAPTAPVKDSLFTVRQKLEVEGINTAAIIRDYDSACWPYADRGFFKLKKKMPKIIGAFSQAKLF